MALLTRPVKFKYATSSTYTPIESEYFVMAATNSQKTVSIATGRSSDPDREVIPQLHDRVPQRGQVKLPCVLLKPTDLNRSFFGRNDIIDAIRDALVPPKNRKGSETELKLFSLYGLGGVGKTEIATEFAKRFKDEFDAVFWITADGPHSLDWSFQAISVMLGLETLAEARIQVVSRSLVKGWLSSRLVESGDDDASSQSGLDKLVSWLIIFDNADDPELLSDYWPEGPGSVLITSRDPLVKRLFSTRASGIDVEPMNEVDGGTLLLKLTEMDGSEETAREISRSLAGLPLAIAQMASIIRRQELSLEECLETYKDVGERASLYRTNLNIGAHPYRFSIASVWDFEKLSHSAKVLLEIITFLDPDIIQVDILFDAASAFLQTSDFGFVSACTELIRSSLIKCDKRKNEMAEFRLSAHRLVQDVVSVQIGGEELTAMFSSLTSLLWAEWPSALCIPAASIHLQKDKKSDRYQAGRYPLCAALFPHIIRMKQQWTMVPHASEGTKVKFAALLKEAAW